MPKKTETKRTFKTKAEAERELYKKRVANMAKARAARLKNLSKRKAAVKSLPTPAQQAANVEKARKNPPPIITDAFRLVDLRNAFEEAIRADERNQIRIRFENATGSS